MNKESHDIVEELWQIILDKKKITRADIKTNSNGFTVDVEIKFVILEDTLSDVREK